MGEGGRGRQRMAASGGSGRLACPDGSCHVLVAPAAMPGLQEARCSVGAGCLRHGAPAELPARMPPSAGKTRGMGAGRKLRLHRKEERWADKDYKKSNLGSEWKKPFAGASHAKGIVLEKM